MVLIYVCGRKFILRPVEGFSLRLSLLSAITVHCSIELQCDVDGGFGDWFDLSACTKSCGGGTKRQARECNKPAPVGDGKRCEGEDTQTIECNKQAVSILKGLVRNH